MDQEIPSHFLCGKLHAYGVSLVSLWLLPYCSSLRNLPKSLTCNLLKGHATSFQLVTVLSPRRQHGDGVLGGIASWATVSCPVPANSGLQQHGDVLAPRPLAGYTHVSHWLTGAAQQPELGPGPYPGASQGQAAELTSLGGGVEEGGAPGTPRAVGRAEPAPDLKHILRVTLQVVLQAGPVLRRILPCLHLRRVQGVRRDWDTASPPPPPTPRHGAGICGGPCLRGLQGWGWAWSSLSTWVWLSLRVLHLEVQPARVTPTTHQWCCETRCTHRPLC